MTLGTSLLIVSLAFVVAVYISLVLITVTKAEELSIKMSMFTAISLPFFVLSINVIQMIKNYNNGNKKRARAILRIGILNYSVGITMLFAIMIEHTAYVNKYGYSGVSEELEFTKKKNKKWYDSIPSYRKLLKSDEFNDSLSAA